MGKHHNKAADISAFDTGNNNNNMMSDETSVPLKMKVTVCFGNVRVIVPCPDPEMLVRDLVHQATLRYKKATGKNSDAPVIVHKVMSQQDGAIFDPDDKLIDVADDREQIMAIYEEDNDGLPSLLHNAGDGTSASSVGTNSPEPNIFQTNERKFPPFGRTDIEITGEELINGQDGNGVVLQVRRGSEPALNRLSPVHMFPPCLDTSKQRWSAAPVVDEDAVKADIENGPTSRTQHGEKSSSSQVSLSSSSHENSVIYNTTSNHQAATKSQTQDTGHQQTHLVGSKSSTHLNQNSKNVQGVQYRNPEGNTLASPARFCREHNRLSMQISGEFGSKWADAADRALNMNQRKEPVGGPSTAPAEFPPRQFSSPGFYDSITFEEQSDLEDNLKVQERISEIVLAYDVGPLGIHLVPLHKSNARNQGLIIQSIEKGGRIDRDGRLEAGDKIVEINGVSVLDVPFQQAQELLRERLNNPELRLKVVKLRRSINNVQHLVSKFNGSGEEKENMVQSQERIVGDARVATVSPTRKMPLQAVPLVRPATTTLITSNTRKIGRKYEISLQKGHQGLGFSITTRDNPAGGNCPIYIKNILPTGAAIDDGRLRPGDRLLEVNSIEITGKSQAEAVSILRNVPLGGVVNLIVSRQERVDLSPKLPRQIPPDKISEEAPTVPWSEREVLTLDIAVLDTEKAGLGISVKGKTTMAQRGNMIDTGIFIKNVIHGGAASRDGRLKPNDQLMSINGLSLLDRSNTDAMETLRRTMTQDGPKPKPGFITITIARRVPSSSAPTTDISACGSSASGDEMDSWNSKNISLSADGSNVEERERIIKSKTPENSTSSFKNDMEFLTDNNYSKSQSLNNQNSHRAIIDHIRSEESERYENSQSIGSLDLCRNPVLERLTSGKSSNQAMRNESYYRATNETMKAARAGRVQPLIVQNFKGEVVLFEKDYSPPQKPPRRSRSSTPDDGLTSPENVIRNHVPIILCSPNAGPPTPSDVTYASQTSLEDEAAGFARDAFGRQSMSEKRHATLDAKGTDTYQRNKKLKEERERQRELQLQQEGLNQQKRAEQLARERNLQDELARRGTKRPFSASTEDDLNQPTPVLQISPCQGSGFQNLQETEAYHPEISPLGRRSLGDHLKELLNQWGHRQIHKTEEIIIPRMNSADSVAEVLKHQPPMSPRHKNSHMSHKGEASHHRGSSTDIGPSLGMKKSSSLESLQTMVQEIQIQEDAKSGYAPSRSAVRVVRGRGCNESFRQAVDRSYEAPLGELGSQMETLAEEEAESCFSGQGNNFIPHSRDSPAASNQEPIYGKKAVPKKKAGLFKGLGSMFRFGRHRKSSHGSLSAAEMKKQQAEIERMDKEDSELAERDKARQAAYSEQMRIQEQYRRLVEKQQTQGKPYGHGHPDPTYGMTVSISNKAGGNYTSALPKGQNFQSSQGNLRPQFRKSMDVQSIRDRERERDLRDINGNPINHLRSSSYDMYNEMTRPGSRVGVVGVDPKKYSHYINYDEIRHHLNNNNSKKGQVNISEAQLRQMRSTVVEQRKKAILESRRHQQHYHSQRREHPREKQERPISNFYEYESVQAALRSGIQNQHLQQPMPSYSHNNSNNGITLPSPSAMPFPDPRHQRSPSQFQAVPSSNHSKQLSSQLNKSSSSTLQHMQSRQQLQQPRPNSLPRRSQKDLSTTLSPTNHQHPLNPLQHQPMDGRYIIYPNPNQQMQAHRNNQNQFATESSKTRLNSMMNQNNLHNHPNPAYRSSGSATTLGSKV